MKLSGKVLLLHVQYLVTWVKYWCVSKSVDQNKWSKMTWSRLIDRKSTLTPLIFIYLKKKKRFGCCSLTRQLEEGQLAADRLLRQQERGTARYWGPLVWSWHCHCICSLFSGQCWWAHTSSSWPGSEEWTEDPALIPDTHKYMSVDMRCL